MRNFLIAAAIAGTVIPLWFFASFFAVNGLDPLAFIGELFANGAAGGFSSDVVISALAFWVWSFRDAARLKIGRWWLVPVTTAAVGLSLALPLYLLMREGKAAA